MPPAGTPTATHGSEAARSELRSPTSTCPGRGSFPSAFLLLLIAAYFPWAASRNANPSVPAEPPPQRFAAERGALLKAEGGKKPEPGTQHGAPAAARQRLPHLTPRTNPAALRDPPGRGWRRGGNGERVGAPCGVGARFVAPTRRCPSGPAAPHGAQRSARDARCAFLRAPLRFWGAGRALFGVRFHFNFSGSGGGGGRRERGSHGRTPRNGYGEKPAPPPKNIN